jgi:hypothetical protein
MNKPTKAQEKAIRIPEVRVVAREQTKYEKKMARLMEKVLNYTWSTAENSKMLKTPWGVLMWTPKQNKS